MSDEWRTFCAIELPDEVRAQLAKHTRRPENIHLTLKFFGNVTREKITLISEAAARVAGEFSPFEIRIGGTGVFRTQVLWIDVEDSSGYLFKLQRRLEEECAVKGFPKENRAYKPHLTIARLRRREDARQLAEAHLQTKFDFIDVRVTEFVLFRSQLSPKGSIYTVISKHRLSR